jgi:hypothetical protein
MSGGSVAACGSTGYNTGCYIYVVAYTCDRSNSEIAALAMLDCHDSTMRRMRKKKLHRQQQR